MFGGGGADVQKRCDFLLPCFVRSSSVSVEGHCRQRYVGVSEVTTWPSTDLAVCETRGLVSKMVRRMAL